MGLKIGVFSDLQATHLIPPFRLTEKYLRDCRRGHAASDILLDYANSNRRGWGLGRKIRFIQAWLLAGNLEKQFLVEDVGGMLQGMNLINIIEAQKNIQ